MSPGSTWSKEECVLDIWVRYPIDILSPLCSMSRHDSFSPDGPTKAHKRYDGKHIKLLIHHIQHIPSQVEGEGVRPVRRSLYITLDIHDCLLSPALFPPLFPLTLSPAPDPFVQWFNVLCTNVGLLTNSGNVVKMAIWKGTAPNQKMNIGFWSGPKSPQHALSR